MSYLDWHVGMKVVCIADAEHVACCMKKYGGVGAKFPLPNGIYTIREIRDDAKYHGNGIKLLLKEIDNRNLVGIGRDGWKCYVEPGFDIEKFRPLVTRHTDISIFTAMLHDQHDKVPA